METADKLVTFLCLLERWVMFPTFWPLQWDPPVSRYFLQLGAPKTTQTKASYIPVRRPKTKEDSRNHVHGLWRPYVDVTILGPFRDRFGVFLGRFWDHFGTISDLLDHFGVCGAPTVPTDSVDPARGFAVQL